MHAADFSSEGHLIEGTHPSLKRVRRITGLFLMCFGFEDLRVYGTGLHRLRAS